MTGDERLAADGFPASAASDMLEAMFPRGRREAYHTLDCPFGCYHPDEEAAT